MIRFLRLFRQFRELEESINSHREACSHEAERCNHFERKADALLQQAIELEGKVEAAQAEAASLRDSLAEANQQNLLLQDRLDATLADRSKLWDLTRECISAERASYQAHVNMSWQTHGFGTPFPEAPQIPQHRMPPAVPPEPIKRRMLPSEMVALGTKKFLEGVGS